MKLGTQPELQAEHSTFSTRTLPSTIEMQSQAGSAIVEREQG